jgi:hypothetical protein
MNKPHIHNLRTKVKKLEKESKKSMDYPDLDFGVFNCLNHQRNAYTKVLELIDEMLSKDKGENVND